MEAKKECEHNYRLIETNELNDKAIWIFYCSRCLDIRIKHQSVSMNKVN